MRTHPEKHNPNKFASIIVTTAMIQRSVFSSEMRSRSSSDEVGSIDSSDADLKVGRIDRGPYHSQSHQRGRNSLKIGLQLRSSTLSLEDPDGEQPVDWSYRPSGKRLKSP